MSGHPFGSVCHKLRGASAHPYMDNTCKVNVFVVADAIAQIEALTALAIQYRDDLRYPPTADSIPRRLAAIEAVLVKLEI